MRSITTVRIAMMVLWLAMMVISWDIVYPSWLGNDLFHSSHRANLLRKDKEFYSKFCWNESADSPYAWFDTDKDEWYLQHVGTGIREYI